MRSTHRLIVIFALTILLPGLVLVFFGLRALLQERRLGEQEIREKLTRVAESAGRQLEFELRTWRQALENPEQLRQAVEAGDVVAISRDGDRITSQPAGTLAYELSPIHEASHLSSALAREAESRELRDKQYDKAIEIYRRLLNASLSNERPEILQRLARTLNKAGRSDEAARTYRLLRDNPPTAIGALPSDLIARFELLRLEEDTDQAVRLYEDLVHGKWRLDQTSYAFYSEKVRQAIAHTSEVVALAHEEARKVALTSAVEHFIAEPRSILVVDGNEPVLAIWRTEPYVAILFTDRFVSGRFLPTTNTDFAFSLQSLEGQMIASTPGTPSGSRATYALQNAGLPLKLEVWPKNSAALSASVARQQNLYFGMLAVVVALLAFGGYFTLRTLRTELSIAQMKSDFVSTVSHEFRSPLAGINQLGEILRDGRVHDEQRRREYYEMIVTETQRLRRLVENILDFSRMEDGRKQFHFAPVQPSEWLQELADDFQTQVAAAGFTIETSIPDGLPCLTADREGLTTAVHNLLDNAVKYSGGSRLIRLAAHANGDGLAISVSDHGIGIGQEDRPRIFEKFYRGGGDIARQVKGVGLGLNLVQHIVKAHGGSVDFVTAQGNGTTFTIHLKTSEREP